MADLSSTTIAAFLNDLDKRNALQLSPKELQAAAKTFEDQWFENASELVSLDSEAFRLIDVPSRLANAILRHFGHEVPALPSAKAAPVSPPRPQESPKSPSLKPSSPHLNHSPHGAGPSTGSGSVSGPGPFSPPSSLRQRSMSPSIDDEKGAQQRPNGPNLDDVIKQVIEKAGDNEIVMQGLTNLLKKGIEDSNGGVVKQNVLRGYLKTVNRNTLQRSSLVLDEKERDVFEEQQARPAPPLPSIIANSGPVNPMSGAYTVEWAGRSCGICKANRDKPRVLDCKHVVDEACLHDYVVELVGRKNAVGLKCPVVDPASGKKCATEVNVGHIQAVLTAEEFSSYLEATLLAFIEQDSLTFKCPNSKCEALIAFQPSRPQEVPHPMTEKDDDGNVLSDDAWRHFQEFRIRCRVCTTVFCAQCKRMPYHKGHTCQSFQEYQKARHCRFCSVKLDDNNLAPTPPADKPGWRDVCTNQECLDKRKICCGRIKGCGCPCNGVVDELEADCLPCLKHDMEMGEEFCTICYVEALKDAPCVQMGNGCNHVYHYQCIVNKLKAGSPGARVSFEYKNCPLCQKPIAHSMLRDVLAPIETLEAEIKKRSLERLIYEGREKDPAIIKPNGRFYNDPTAFAMHQFLFYMCFKCKKPYFAGGYQCQEANAAFDPEELVCPGCQPHSVDNCPTHGMDWLAFKCRFCCSYANWYCWGCAHFCDQCHKSGVWQKLCEFRTGKNKKKVWDYDQCPGIAKAMPAIVNDKSLNDDQKERKLEALVCDPFVCPLKLPHPPNGFEYGLGCSMCEDKKTEAKNEEAARKAKLEAEQKRQALDAVKRMLKEQPKGMLFTHQSDMDENGVFHYLGTCGKSQKWMNPCDAGFVSLSSVGMMGDSAPLSALVGKELVRCVTKPVRNAWVLIDLVDMSLELTHYTLKHYSSWDTECLRNWVLEGSNDGVTWETLRQHVNDQALNKKGGTHTWSVDAQRRRFRMFRILQTGYNSNNHFYLALSGSEFYGRLFDGVAAPDEDKFAEEKRAVVNFNHSYDFDTGGMLYYLGTDCGKNKNWQNPALSGAVIASCSSLAEKPASMPASAICGRELVRCVTMAKPNQWFSIDLKDKQACVSEYTIKHYDSWDTEALRNWRFEGSNDGNVWILLREHVNDPALQAKGSTYTWKIENAQQKGFFSMFRLLQTGRNSNNHYYLACSGLELYGALSSSPPVSIPQDGLDLKYSYDFDSNGVFYWIGTRGRRQPWRNPGVAGLVACNAAQLANNPASAPATAIVGRELTRCVSAAVPNMWFSVDLRDKRLRPTHYTLRHYNSWDTEALRNWVFEASNDGQKWAVIKDHVNDAALDKKGATFTWQLTCSQSFQMFRIRQTGLNSNQHHYLACSGLELYGRLFDAAHADNPNGAAMYDPIEAKSPAFKFPDGLEFKYVQDLDENGFFYWLGTEGKTKPYENPGKLGILRVTASPLASQSLAPWAAAGRELVRCATEPKKGTFFAFDFSHLKMFLIPTAYTLRHYDSWDTEALRNWKLEGSIDGKKWKTLMSHKKDKALDLKGATFTWPIKGITKSYSMFRITQTGKNSNKHWYLCLSGFEIYGQLYSYRKK